MEHTKHHGSRNRKKKTSHSENSTEEIKETNDEKIVHIKHKAPYGLHNEHIHYGYRKNFNTFCSTLKSVFMLHNETANIWTHFIAAIIFIVLIFTLTISHKVTVEEEMSQVISSKFEHLIEDHFNTFQSENCEFDLAFMHKHKEKCSLMSRGLIQAWENEFQAYIYEEMHSYSSKPTDHQNSDENNLKITKISKEVQVDNVILEIEVFITSIVDGFKNLDNFIHCKELYKEVLISFAHTLYTLHEEVVLFMKKTDFSKILTSYRFRMDNLIDVMENIKMKISEIIDKNNNTSYENIQISDIFKEIDNRVHQVSPIPIYIFLFSAMTCFFCSTLYHMFIDCSSKASLVFSRVDFGGISLLICGSMIAPIYYTLICDQTSSLRNFYIGFSVFSCSFAFISMLTPFISHPNNK